MPMISVRDNENNKWKSNAKKDRKKQEGMEAIEKMWEWNDFVMHLS